MTLINSGIEQNKLKYTNLKNALHTTQIFFPATNTFKSIFFARLYRGCPKNLGRKIRDGKTRDCDNAGCGSKVVTDRMILS